MDDYIDFKEIRKQLDITQEQLALKLGVSVVTVQKWEQGKNKPSRLALRQIYRLLKEINRGN